TGRPTPAVPSRRASTTAATPPAACQYLCCHFVGCVLRPRPRCAPARPPHAASCVSVPLLPLRRLRAAASPSLRSGETSARRLLRVSTSAATSSAACCGLALAALRRDLRTPPPACQAGGPPLAGGRHQDPDFRSSQTSSR